jgi:hypothetical protein
MAITNAQQFKQLVNPPMEGKKRPGYRGDDAYGGGDSVAGGGDQGNVGGNRDAREIGARLSRTQAMARANQRALAALGDPDPEVDVPTRLRKDTGTSFLKNLNAERRANPFLTAASVFNPVFGLPSLFKVAKQTGDMRKALGVQSPTPVNRSGGDGGENLPYWAQLGFSSEEEYLNTLRAQTPSTTDQGTTMEDDEGLRLAFRADGGPIGGEYDFESARQMYGLGKLVKKVTRTVKKIAKSPIGKAAIVGAGFGLAGMGPFKGLANTPFGTGLTKNFLKFKGTPLGETIFGKAIGDTDMTRTGGLLGLIKDNPVISGITAASVVGGLLTPEEEEQAEELSRGEGIDIEQARNSILAARRDDYKMDFRARGFKAEGGPAEGKEPVAKKTMPLLDMDGKEMDLRAEGGFVPIGRMEKADDVPARLSKNEFVFTADAVRNAGEGNVDKGAEVMYNMMKNLESGGEVSEESQGLEGARKMFQTSQRLEEVL